jgi:multidrug efflux pump subunit AcrB
MAGVTAGDPVSAASAEITGAVVGSTLTTVLVFVPLAFIVGVYGQFFAALSWSLSLAVLVSMVVSLTVVPVMTAKFLGNRPMPDSGPIYYFFERGYELLLRFALRWPWAAILLSFAAVGRGVLLVTAIPNIFATKTAGEGQPAPLVRGLETGLMPSMDEGAFVLDYWTPTGTPLKRTEQYARVLEQILSEHPDVEVYVRRSGAGLGMFANKTSKGDIQVALRPAENDPFTLLTKAVRPPLDEIQDELKRDGKEAIRNKHRRRPLTKVMDEIEDEIKERFAAHQLQFELIQIMEDELNDLSGANRPVEVKLFGPDYKVLRQLAEEISGTLETNGKGKGIKEVSSHVYAGNPDLLIHVDGVRAQQFGLTAEEVERQLRVIYLGHVATQVRESALRITDVRVRYPDSIRFGPNGRFMPNLLRNQWILVPTSTAPAGVSDNSLVELLSGPARAVPVATVTPVRTPDEQHRENQQPGVFISADLDYTEAGLGTVVQNLKLWMKEIALPPEYRWELGGHYPVPVGTSRGSRQGWSSESVETAFDRPKAAQV